LRQRQWSVNELARETSVKAGEIGEDLRHLQLSLKRQREVIQVKPAVCRKYGFVCSGEKMTKPSRCPECKQTRLQEPLVWIEVKGD
jgi:predicted Zn-ribbon and HTH transcriptional regulator